MRTDVTIDRRQVRCPNASTLGFGKWRVQVGDLVVFSECGHMRTGRMIGRVHYAPSCSDSPVIRDHVLVLVLSESLNHTYERWVNPIDILRVESLRDQRGVMSYFLSDLIVKAPINEVRKSTSDGWSTLTKYRAYMAQRTAEQADFERRHPKGICQCKLCLLSTATTPEQADRLASDFLGEVRS